MERKAISAAILAGLVVTTSCGSQKKCQSSAISESSQQETVATAEEEKLVGAWEPIRISSDCATFGAEGGSLTVSCENYRHWWLDDIQITGTDKFYLADPGENNTYLTASAPGIKAVVTDSNKLVITVDASAKPCKWTIHLQSGDAFTEFTVIKK